MRNTRNYNLPYYEQGNQTAPTADLQRFSTIDNQIFGLANIFGNGVLSGWEVVTDQGLKIAILPGTGFINYVFAATSTTIEIPDLPENTTVYIYARFNDTQTYTMNPSFIVSTQTVTSESYVILATVTTGTNTIILIDTSVRRNIGFIAKIIELIQQHHHNGETDSPSKIDLLSEVAGILPGYRIGDIDAAQIKSGRLDPARIPQLDHLLLKNVGILTHPQIDSFIQNLQNPNRILFGEIATSNVLQYILSLKHSWNKIDEFFFNELAFIPGISPDFVIDIPHTTAIIDKTNHEIRGILARTGKFDFIDFKNKVTFDAAPKTNVRVVYDQTTLVANLQLTRPALSKIIDDFGNVSLDAQDIPNYVISTEALNDQSYFRSNIDEKVSGQFGGQVHVEQGQRIRIERTFDAADDWSTFSRLSMYVRSNSNTHGRIWMDIVSNGTAIATFMVLDDKEITDGFVERNFNLAPIINRNVVTGIRFRTDTTNGWIPTTPFDVYFDKIAIYNDLFYEAQGSSYFRFNAPIPTKWRNISFEAETPDNTSVYFRVRAANSEIELSVAPFTPPISVSGTALDLQDTKYIEIEATLKSNIYRTSTPVLKSIRLGISIDSSIDNINVSTHADWAKGKLFENIDINTIPDSARISDPIRVGDIYYGRHNIVQQISPEKVAQVATAGNRLPLSPRQAAGFVKQVNGFEYANHVFRLDNRNFLIADTLNDRVVEMDKNSNPVFILQANTIPLMGSPAFFPTMAYFNPNTSKLLIGMSRKLVPTSVVPTLIVINSQNDTLQLDTTDTVVQQGSDAVTAIEISLSADHKTRLITMFNNSSVYIRFPNGTFLENIDSTYPAYKNISTILGFPMYSLNVALSTHIFQPVSVDITPEGNWIIGNARTLAVDIPDINSIVEIDTEDYSLIRASNAVDMNLISLGAAKRLHGGDWILAGCVANGETNTTNATGTTTDADILLKTKKGRITVLRGEDLSPLVEYDSDANLYPSDVSEDTDGYLVVAEKSLLTINGGRIIKMDFDGNILRQFGQGGITFPNDVRVLDNGNYFVSL